MFPGAAQIVVLRKPDSIYLRDETLSSPSDIYRFYPSIFCSDLWLFFAKKIENISIHVTSIALF